MIYGFNSNGDLKYTIDDHIKQDIIWGQNGQLLEGRDNEWVYVKNSF